MGVTQQPFLSQPELVNEAGYLAGGAQFGLFTSRSLTARASNGRPAGLTPEQSIETMPTAQISGTGTRRSHRSASDALAYVQQDDDRELEAIYEYLRAIPCLDQTGSGRCHIWW